MGRMEEQIAVHCILTQISSKRRTDAQKFTHVPECHATTVEPTTHAQMQLTNIIKEKPHSEFDPPHYT